MLRGPLTCDLLRWAEEVYLCPAADRPPGCADRASVFEDLKRQWESSPDISTAREALYALPAATQSQQLQVQSDCIL